jgi:adenylate cyclase
LKNPEQYEEVSGIVSEKALTEKKWRYGVLAGCIGFLLALVLWLPGLLEGWEARTWDWRVRLLARPGPATERIKIILLNQNSLDWAKRENGWPWPWPREAYIPIIDFCRRNGVKALAFDVLFTEPSVWGVEDDRRFGQALARCPGFIGSFSLSQTEGSDREWPPNAAKPGFRIEGLDLWLAVNKAHNLGYSRTTFPIPEIAGQAKMLANVHDNPDPDGIYRYVMLFSLFDGRIIPSLALGAYLQANPGAAGRIEGHALSIGNRVIPIDQRGKVILNYRGPSGTHQTVSAAAVIQSELNLQAGEKPTITDTGSFRDAFVFFGFSAPGLYDLRPAPVSGIYPGVEIHATVLDNLLSGDFIRLLPRLPVAALVLVMTLLAGLMTSRVSSLWKSALVYTVFILLPVLFSLAAYRFHIWLPVVVQEAGIAFTLIGSGLIYYTTEGRQKRFIKNAFKQYLSPDVIEELIRNPERLKLGGERRELSIFFSDLEGFTGISEGLEPEALTALLNEYLSAMTDIIQEEGGTVDKFEGDAIIAFWNAPLPQPDHARRCVRSAIRCQEKLAEMRPAFRERIGKDLKMRIGINTGPAVVGNLGSRTRFDYTMLGDAVNLAARLEGINKQFGTYTIVSESSFAQLEGIFPCRELSRVAVVGRKEPVRIFEPLSPETYALRSLDIQIFSEGLEAFYKGDFVQAAARFAGLGDSDPAARSYHEKCLLFIANPPEDWKGVWVVTTK